MYYTLEHVPLKQGLDQTWVETSFLPPEWRQKFNLVTVLHIPSASFHDFITQDTNQLLVRFEDLPSCIPFGAFYNLALPICIVTWYIRLFMKGIFLMKQMIGPDGSGAFPILSVCLLTVYCNLWYLKKCTAVVLSTRYPFFEPWNVFLPPNSDIMVPIPNLQVGLQYLSLPPIPRKSPNAAPIQNGLYRLL